MSIALLVYETESIKKLLEDVASSGLGKTFTESKVLEKLTASDKLMHNKIYLLLAFLWMALLSLDFD